MSEKTASGKLKKVDMETALDGARLSLLTHSFGERMARTAGNELFDALTSKHTFDVPYTPEEAEAICKQVLVIGLGGALEYDVDRMMSGETAYAKPVSHLNHVSLYGECEESVRMAAEAKPDSLLIACSNHSQDAYMHALETQPQVVDALNHLINEKRLPERAVEIMAPVLPSIDLLNRDPEFHPKMASFSHMKGISINDNIVSYAKDGEDPKPILTIIRKGNELSFDSAPDQRTNLAMAMQDSDQLQHVIFDNLNHSFKNRAAVMARHQLEAEMKNGQIPEHGGTREYDFEERIRGDMREKAARIERLGAHTREIVWGFPGAAPDGRSPVLETENPDDPDCKAHSRNSNAINHKCKEERRLLKGTVPMPLETGDIITIGGADHFQGLDDNQRKANSLKFAAELSHMLDLPPGKVKTLMVPSAIKQEHDLSMPDEYGKYFAQTVLLPRVTRKNGDKLEPLPIEEAEKNMRISIATHSFGGKLASMTMLELEHMMTNKDVVQPPFSREDAKRIGKQVFQFDLGPAYDYSVSEDGIAHVAMDPMSTRVQAYLPRDPDLKSTQEKIRQGDADIKPSHIYVLNTPSKDCNFVKWGSRHNFQGVEQHTRALYIESLEQKPEVVNAIKKAVTSQRIDPDVVIQDFANVMPKLDTSVAQELPTLDNTASKAMSEPEQKRGVGA